MLCGEPPYNWECPDCGTNLTRQGMTSTYSTFYCDGCGFAFCVDTRGRLYDNEDDAGPLRFRQLEYLDINDICDKFNVDIRDFAFTCDANNGEYVWFGCDEDSTDDYSRSAEDLAGSRYERRYHNDLMLAEYLSEEMGIKQGVMILIHW